MVMGYPVALGIPARVGIPPEMLGPPVNIAPMAANLHLQDFHHGPTHSILVPHIPEGPTAFQVSTPSTDSAILSYTRHGEHIGEGKEILRAEETIVEANTRRENFNQLLSHACVQHGGGGSSLHSVIDPHVGPQGRSFDVAAGAAELGTRWKEVQAAIAEGAVEYA